MNLVARDGFLAKANWLIALSLALAGALAPLADIDLPMHLATGEWIARRHAVPTVEPFAWTRAGAPFFAYSWLAELTYYEVLRSAGHVGLRIVNGLSVAGAWLAMLSVGHAARWRRSTTLVMAVANVALLVIAVPHLRPQGWMFVLVPLAWSATYSLAANRRVWPNALLLLVVSALAVNTHLFFPLTAAPLVLFLLAPEIDLRRGALALGAVLGGWCLTPYLFDLPRIFALNFSPNALLSYESRIGEHRPGFRTSFWPIGAALALLPLMATSIGARARLLLGAMWLVGLLAFAVALKSLMLWWLLSIPLAAAALAILPDIPERFPSLQAIELSLAVALLPLVVSAAAVGPIPFAWAWPREGDTRWRSLPSIGASSVEPLATWLDTHAVAGARARTLTVFHLGSYLVWRLPGYSPSIDGRTIFPDSAALPDAAAVMGRAQTQLGPWRSAEVAIVPLNYAVASVLDTAAHWHRFATVERSRDVPESIGLWSRDDWAARNLRAQILERPNP